MSQTLRRIKFIIGLLVTFVVAILSSHAASQMIFGVLGRTPAEPDWSYTMALFLIFVTAAVTLATSMLVVKKSLKSRLMITISASMSGAWLGFYYGGIITGGKNPQIAISAAVIAGLLMAVTSFYLQKRLTIIVIVVMAVVATYGLAFLCSAATFALLSTNDFLWGSIWAIFSLGAIALTIVFLNLLVNEIASYLS